MTEHFVRVFLSCLGGAEYNDAIKILDLDKN